MQSRTKYWIEQLAQHLRQADDVAQRAEADAREAAKTLATESEKKEDGRAVLEFGSLATGPAARARAAREELQILTRFYEQIAAAPVHRDRIALGAVVDVGIESPQGGDERTFIVLPVGAGTELTGPGGDGFLTVITPNSPVGKAMMGKRAGDIVEVTIRGEPLEGQVIEVG